MATATFGGEDLRFSDSLRVGVRRGVQVNTDFIQVDADTRDMLKESEPCWLSLKIY